MMLSNEWMHLHWLYQTQVLNDKSWDPGNIMLDLQTRVSQGISHQLDTIELQPIGETWSSYEQKIVLF